VDAVSHFIVHLAKEESDCLPLVMEHLTIAEMKDLVGNIMGKRSSENMEEIMSLVSERSDRALRGRREYEPY
tara:strand:- start:309 stop:524 length:216 start_codon:yes stop_codon:yes gene_type:complete